MLFRDSTKARKFLMPLGTSCLVVALLSRLFLHPHGRFTADLADGVTGFLFGISIAFLGMNAWLAKRRTSRPCD